MSNVTGTHYYSTAEIGYESEFLVGQGGTSPETYVALPNVTDIDLGGFKAGIISKLHLRSPGRAEEKKSTIRDYDDIKVKLNYDRTHGAFKIDGGDGFSATHNIPRLHLNQTEANFLALIGETSPREEVAIRGVISGMTRPKLNARNLMEVELTITPLRDYLTSSV